ncbi:MAG: DUF2254 domain-containing protein [Pyrinomonadaceae bacterium]
MKDKALMNKLRVFWTNVKSSLWFVPTTIVIVAMALAVGLIELSTLIDRELLLRYPRVFGVGADGSRGMLSAIAGSMITVAGLTFSLTIAALAQASNQYTPRILRAFMRDRANQFVLGVFVGIFAYCLIVLRTIRGGDEGGFVPSLAVLFGLLLALVSIGALVFFIHHIASSLQASSIVSNVAEETLEAIERLFPQELGEAADEGERQAASETAAHEDWRAVPSLNNGYIQSVDTEELLAFARTYGVIIRMERGIGQFTVKGDALVSFAGARRFDDKIVAQLNDIYTINHFRTIEQDAPYGIRQIVDIALKALSPGVNDTTTAIFCIDYLGAILAQLARRRISAPYRTDGGKVRVITKSTNFTLLVATSFDQIRGSGAGNVAVMRRILGAIKIIARQTPNAGRREVLREQAQLVSTLADRTLEGAYEREQIKGRVIETLAALETQRHDAAAVPVNRVRY